MIATLDLYSGGRTIIGVGAGWLREETEVMGTNFRLRWRRLRETTEALRLCWTEKEPSYQGEMVQFPPVFCDPKPVQKAGPPIFLGGHVPKALERVARTYDGWCPLAFDPEDYKTKVESIRTMAREFGRDPDALQMSAFIDPKDGTLSADEMQAYRDAGASRIVLFSSAVCQSDCDRSGHAVHRHGCAHCGGGSRGVTHTPHPRIQCGAGSGPLPQGERE